MQSRPLALAMALALSACIFDDDRANRGTIVDNEVRVGTILLADGKPAANAEVEVFTVDHVPEAKAVPKSAGRAFATRTDAQGRYRLDSLPAGEYNILARLDEGYAYRDSVVLTATTIIPRDTLAASGSLSGIVALEPNHDPRSAFVQVLGTNTFVNADSAGRFTLANLARGEYSLRVVTGYEGYTPWFGGVRVRAGQSDTLAQPIRPAYTRIPVVRALRAEYDTATGRATVSWRPPAFGFLKEYLIFREDASSLTPSLLPIARTTDTFFIDDLAGIGPGISDPPYPRFEYEVRIRNLSGEIGLPFGSVVVEAVPASAVGTVIDLKVPESRDGRVQSGSDLRLIADWRSPARPADSAYWIDTAGKVLRALAVKGLSGSDTLRLKAPSAAGMLEIRFRVKDKVGDAWLGSIALESVTDAPRALAGADTIVSIGDTLRLRGAGTDLFGSVEKLEWNLGPGGGFVEAAKGEATFVTRSIPGFDTLILRVTDNDGLSAKDTLRITSIDDVPLLSVSVADRSYSEGGGFRLTAKAEDRGRIVKWEWSTDSATGFHVRSGGDTAFVPQGRAGDTIVCRVRVTDDDGHLAIASVKLPITPWALAYQGQPISALAAAGGKLYAYHHEQTSIAAFDPKTWAWDAPIPITISDVRHVGSGNLFYLMSISGLFSYNTDLGAWTKVATFAFASRNYHATTLGKKVYFYHDQDFFAPPQFLVFDPADNTFTGKTATPVAFSQIAGLGSKVYGFLTSFSYPAVQSRAYAYDTATGVWEAKSSIIAGTPGDWSAVIGDKIYFGGDRTILEYHPATDTWKEKTRALYGSGIQSAAVWDGKIYLADDHGRIQVYDPELDP